MTAKQTGTPEQTMLMDKVAAYETIVKAIEQYRQAEIKVSRKILSSESLPGAEASPAETAANVCKILDEARALAIADSKHLKYRFGVRSEKALIRAGEQRSKVIEKLCREKQIKRSEYERKRQILLTDLSKLQELIDRLSDATQDHAVRLEKLETTFKATEDTLKQLERLQIIEDQPVEQDKTNQGHTSKDTPGATSSAVVHPIPAAAENSHKPEAPEKAEGAESTEHKELQKVNYVIKNSQSIDVITGEPQPKQARRRGREEALHPDSAQKIAEQDMLRPLHQGIAINPLTGETGKLYGIDRRTRVANVLDEAVKHLQRIRAAVLTVHTQQGDVFEINPASTSDLEVLDREGKVKMTLNSALMLKPCPDSEQQAKDRLNDMAYSKALMDILREYHGALIFSPTEMLGTPGEIYGARPIFVSSGISERHAIRLIIDFMALLVPKSTLATVNTLQNDNDYFSRQHVVKIINSVGRCLSPLASELRRILFTSCRTWHNDETTWRCMELLRSDQTDKNSKKKRSKNYLWTLVTGKHEPKQGVVYLAAEDRSHGSFMRQFGLVADAESGQYILPEGFDIKIENLITDCYTGYRKGVELLEKLLGRPLLRACCFAHLRKYFIEALDTMRLAEVFLNICTGSATGYGERLEAELKAQDIKPGINGQRVMIMTFLIELILRLDRNFAVETRGRLEDIRQQASSGNLEQLYEIAAELLEASPTIKQVGEIDGILQYEGGQDLPWGKALVYLMNNRKEFTAFLKQTMIRYSYEFIILIYCHFLSTTFI